MFSEQARLFTPANMHSLIVTTDSNAGSCIAKIECLTINACTNRKMGKGSGGRWVELLRMSHTGFGAYERCMTVAPKPIYPLYTLLYYVLRHHLHFLRHVSYGAGKGFAQTERANCDY
jgi:hypothetical protein